MPPELQNRAGTPPKSRRVWRIAGRGGQWLIARGIDLWPDDQVENPFVVVDQLTAWCASPNTLSILRELGEYTGGARSTEELRQRLAEAFRAKRLLALRMVRGPSTGLGSDSSQTNAPPPPPPPKAPPKEKEEKTWFRCQLFDEDGEKMANEKYSLTDSNGTKREGTLDSDGCVYIPAILTPGNCTISFPDIHLNPKKKKKK